MAIKSGILTLFGIKNGPVFNFFRVPLLKKGRCFKGGAFVGVVFVTGGFPVGAANKRNQAEIYSGAFFVAEKTASKKSPP